MNSPLYAMVSGLTAMLVVLAWIKPQTFSFLRDKDSHFPSLGRQGQYTALLASTWVLVTLTLQDGKLPEWYGMGYMLAWAGAQFSSVWLKIKGQAK